MNLATLGVEIDPTGAVTGGDIATKASEKMADNMTADAAQVAKATQQSSAAIVAAATTQAAAQGKAATAAQTSSTAQVAAAQRAAQAAQAMASSSASTSMWERMQAAARSASSGVTSALDRLRAGATSAMTGVNNSVLSVSVSAASMVNRVSGSIGSLVGGAFNSLRSGATSAANGVASAFNRAGTTVANSLARMRSSLSGLRGSFSTFTDVSNALGVMASPLGNAVYRFESLGRVMSSIPAFAGPVLAIIGGLVLAFGSLAGSVALVHSAMERAGPIQAAAMGLETITGSARQADAVLTALRENAMKTGGDLGENIKISTKFIGLGFSPADAVKMNSSIQDIAGTLGMTTAQAGELGNALAQVQSKGVVSMEELRQQIAEKGVPVFQELAKAMKVSQSQLIDMVGKGQVPAKALIDIFLNLEGSFAKFAGGAERATAKLPGAVNQAKAIWNDLLVTMGTPINDAVAPLINSFSASLRSLAPEAEQLGTAIAGVFTKASPYIESFFSLVSGKLHGLMAMAQSSDGLGVSWARNTWVTFVEYGMAAVSQIVSGFMTLGQLLARFAVDFIETLATVTTPEFWQMMGGQLSNIGIMFENALRAAAEGFINLIRDNTPAWLKSGDNTRADFGRLAVPTIPTPKINSPDLYNDNNTPLDMSEMMAKNTAAAKAALEPVTEYWQTFNRLKTKAAEPLPKNPTPNAQGLSTVGTADDPGSFSAKAAKDAEKLARQMEASAKKYIESSRTALQTYAATINEINTLQGAGLLSTEQAAAASAKAVDKLNEATKAAALKAASPMEKLIMQWGTLKNQISEANATMTQSFTNNFASAISSIVQGTASASQAWHQMTTAIIGDITQTIVKLMVQWAIQKALGLITGVAVPTTYTAATANAAAGVASAGVHHTGGTVGSPAVSRMVPVSAFAGARRYQHGGEIPGVSSGERAVIAEPGETVQTAQQTRDIRARLGDKKQAAAPIQVHVANLNDPAQIAAYFAQNPGAFLNILSQNKTKASRILGIP